MSNDNEVKGAKKADKRKQSLYLPADVVDALTEEAARLDRSLSWVVQRCVKLALNDIRQMPSVESTSTEDE